MRIFSFLLISFFLFSCSHAPSKLESDVKIGQELTANRYSNIYFSKQPEKKDLETLKENGFVAVINLRLPKEHKAKEEKKIVTSNGLAYYNMPFDMKKELTNKYIDQVTAKIKAHRKEGKVLLHCSTGNRAAIFAGAHFYKDHGQSKEEAFLTAKKLGLNKKKAIEKLQKYFSKN